MEVADRLAVIHHGRLEQVGSPAELYDHPANDFVLTFVGPATSLGGRYVRPHDVAIARESPGGESHAARVVRVISLGFEVRVELEMEDGTTSWVQLDRATARALDLSSGERVYAIAGTTSATVGGAARGG